MKARTVVAATLVSICAVIGIALSAAAGEAGAGKAVKVLCFGDSITYGYSASDQKTTSYPAVLQKLLDEKHGAGAFEVVNSGVSGETTAQGLSRIDKVLAEERPAWVLVLYGTNDLWTSRKLAPADTEKNIKAILERVKAAGAKAVTGTILPVWDEAERVARRNESITKAAKDEGAVVADLNAAFEEALKGAGGNTDKAAWLKYYALEDESFLHPNDEGNALLAAKWLDALEAAAAK